MRLLDEIAALKEGTRADLISKVPNPSAPSSALGKRKRTDASVVEDIQHTTRNGHNTAEVLSDDSLQARGVEPTSGTSGIHIIRLSHPQADQPQIVQRSFAVSFSFATTCNSKTLLVIRCCLRSRPSRVVSVKAFSLHTTTSEWIMQGASHTQSISS